MGKIKMFQNTGQSVRDLGKGLWVSESGKKENTDITRKQGSGRKRGQ